MGNQKKALSAEAWGYGQISVGQGGLRPDKQFEKAANMSGLMGKNDRVSLEAGVGAGIVARVAPGTDLRAGYQMGIQTQPPAVDAMKPHLSSQVEGI